MSGVHAYVFDGDPRRPWLAARSVRSLKAAGLESIRILEAGEIPESSPALLLRAGNWLSNPGHLRTFHANAPVAYGLPPFHSPGQPWLDLQARHGGHLSASEILPPPECEWHPGPATAIVRLRDERLPPDTRLVHLSALDFTIGKRPRVLEIVTSLQHGGAEKIAADLARHLPAHGVDTLLAVLGKPLRRTLSDAPSAIDLSHLPRDKRVAAIRHLVDHHGIDVLHLHLTDAEETRALATLGLPVIVTVHNTAEGWPANWETLGPQDVTLFIACANAVANDLRQRLPAIPVRTVWNGIDPIPATDRPHPPFTLACIANPRPQKRLERLPAILAATRAKLGCEVRLIVAGEVSERHAPALACRDQLEAEAIRHATALEFTHGALEIPAVLSRAHALVSCSAHEGLSLAHLEALSAGLPVIATAVGGTAEIASRCPALRLVPPDADPETFAAAIVETLLDPPPSSNDAVRRDFSIASMAARTASLIKSVISQATGRTFWFVTNNLSTGGAQSSIRRLVLELQRRGHRTRLALLQEYPDRPTPGRRALVEAGIDIFTPPPIGIIDPVASADLILAEMAADPPRSVVFWNALAIAKFLLAQALPFTRVIDVSPGEMLFASLDRWLETFPAGLPVCGPADYGRLLHSMVVKYQAESLRATTLGAPVRVIPNGIALPLPRVPIPCEKLVFGTAARLSPQKRIEDLIAAFRVALPDLPPCVLRIAGDAETGSEDYATELRRQSEGLPIEWLGEITDLASFHAGLDIFVMISNPAGCPNASMEALAAGLPVIATDIGGAAEQVIDHHTGRLIPPCDPAAFARAMTGLAASPEARRQLGRNARRHMEENFSLDRMTRAWLSVME